MEYVLATGPLMGMDNDAKSLEGDGARCSSGACGTGGRPCPGVILAIVVFGGYLLYRAGQWVFAWLTR